MDSYEDVNRGTGGRGWLWLRHGGDFSDCTYVDWTNPFNFYGLLLSPISVLIQWMIGKGLLCSFIICPLCGSHCNYVPRKQKVDRFSWRCRREGHDIERSIRHNSFFDYFRLQLPDVLNFVKLYLDALTLKKCAEMTNIGYRRTAVEWAKHIRHIFVDFIWINIIQPQAKFSGEVEIDESVFGHKMKYHKGKPNRGVKVWVVGLIERATNNIILYPVENRKEQTLIKIIQRHVEPGTQIFTDGWVGYRNLNELGYQHFTVVHKYQFTQSFRDTSTGQIIQVHTNTMEGAWMHAKKHFINMSGTSLTQFESHICEIMFRNRAKRNLYEFFFNHITSMYALNTEYHKRYPTPIFDTWTMPERENVKDFRVVRQLNGT